MKKKLITSICLLLLPMGIMLNAQGSDDPRENLSIGVKAGFNRSNVWDERGQDFRADPKNGFAGGVFIGIPIGAYLGVQPEALISQKGFRGSGTLLLTPYSFSRTTTYIDFPLQLQLKPVEYVTLLAGPQYSYLIHEKNVYTFGANSTEQNEEFENDNVRKNILGFVAGLDIIISHVVVSGRVGWDFQNNHGDGSNSTPRYKNQWLQFTAGLKF
jgi:hypothetical protein